MKAILLCALALMFSSVASAAATIQQLSQARAVVKPVVVGAGGSGSAIILSPTTALSSAHLVRPNSPLFIKINGQDVPVTPKFVDNKNDLALLEGALACPCATISPRDAVVDEEVIIVGYPLGSAIKYIQFATEGRAQWLDTDGDMWTTAHAVPGNSGGGLFVVNGDGVVVVGVLKGIATAGPLRVFPNMSYAVGVSVIRAFLVRAGS